MRHRILLLLTLCVVTMTCNESSDSGFAPTGAKGTTDEFGQKIYVDEECGGTDDPHYGDGLQNAMYRDGAVYDSALWLVDGSHVWRADLRTPANPDDLSGGVPTPRIVHDFVGHANAVTAGDDFVAVALVERGVAVYPRGKVADAVYLREAHHAVDVAARGSLLAVGDLKAGVLVYDLGNPYNPLPLYSAAVTGTVVGVEWDRTDAHNLYYAACSRVGRFEFEAGYGAARWASSGLLEHRNAKDIAASGRSVFVANNGMGLWFFNADLHKWMQRNNDDPNFYANSVALGYENVYLAAGNLQLIAFSYEGMQQRSVPRDPIGVMVDGPIVYGFGNFREVGERTVLRSSTIESAGVAAFERGGPRLVEPYFLQPATAATDSGVVTRASIFFDGEHRVYERAPTESAWRRLPDFRFFGNAGTYTVDVTSDATIRVYALGASQPAYEVDMGIEAPEVYERLWDIRTFENGFAYSYDSFGSVRVTTAYGIKELGLHEKTLQSSSTRQVDYVRLEPEVLQLSGNLVDSVVDESEPINRIFFGMREHADCATAWFSRQFDAMSVENEPNSPAGTYFLACTDQTTGWIRTGGIIDVLPVSDGYMLLQDIRRSNAAAVVFVDRDLHETQRWVHMGRPSGFTLEDPYVRLWFADGHSFRFDPDGPLEKLDAFEPIIR